MSAPSAAVRSPDGRSIRRRDAPESRRPPIDRRIFVIVFFPPISFRLVMRYDSFIVFIGAVSPCLPSSMGLVQQSIFFSFFVILIQLNSKGFNHIGGDPFLYLVLAGTTRFTT